MRPFDRGTGKRCRQLKDYQGFSLIEVVVSLLIIAIGILGIAGMQGISLGRNVDASQLSQATNLAADMIERIRFNRGNATAYNGCPCGGGGFGAGIDTTNVTTRPDQSTQPQAAGDFDQWQQRLTASGLPGARGRVTVQAVGPPALSQFQIVVFVDWNRGMNSGYQGVRVSTVASTVRLDTIVAM